MSKKGSCGFCAMQLFKTQPFLKESMLREHCRVRVTMKTTTQCLREHKKPCLFLRAHQQLLNPFVSCPDCFFSPSLFHLKSFQKSSQTWESREKKMLHGNPLDPSVSLLFLLFCLFFHFHPLQTIWKRCIGFKIYEQK